MRKILPPLLFLMAIASPAIADDAHNLCAAPEHDPNSLVSIPADDAIHLNADGSPTYFFEEWYWNSDLVGLDGHTYGVETLVFQFSPGGVPTPVVQIALTDVATGEYQSQLIWGSAPYPFVQNGFDVDVADEGGSFQAIGGAGNDSLVFNFSDGSVVDLKFDGIKDPTPSWFNGFASLVDPVTGKDHGDQYYYNRRDMAAYGTIQRPGKREVSVAGVGWFDREYGGPIGTPGTPDDNVRWKWFSIHLSDGSDYMVWDIDALDTGNSVLHVINKVGPAPACSESLITDYTITPTGQTVSSAGPPPATLDTGNKLSIPSENLQLTIEPFTTNQIVLTGGLFAPFFEGASTMYGTENGFPVVGTGYYEEFVSCCQSP
jgi:predicted secreted hydrolase